MGQFLMPSLGADMEAGTLIEWLKSPGDTVSSGDLIAVVETQKGAIEIEAFEDGIMEEYLVEIGKKVPVGTPLAIIRTKGEAPEEKVVQQKAPEPEPSAPDPAAPNPAAASPTPESAPTPATPLRTDRVRITRQRCVWHKARALIRAHWETLAPALAARSLWRTSSGPIPPPPSIRWTVCARPLPPR